MNVAPLPIETLLFLLIVAGLTIRFHEILRKTTAYGPTILTTIGIFATFFGIAVGLAKFDQANIQASVPALLGGLKTAFWASVAGVGGALTIKLRHYFAGVKQDVSGSGAGPMERSRQTIPPSSKGHSTGSCW